MVVSLFQAATLAPLVPLADALSLAHARPREKNMKGFEYGWVRGTGSAAFIAGTLLTGHVTGGSGLSAIVWLSAAAYWRSRSQPAWCQHFPQKPAGIPQHRLRIGRG
jgi:MFS family permease